MATMRDLMRQLEDFRRSADRANERRLISGKRTSATTVTLTDGAPAGTFWARSTDEARDEIAVYGSCSASNIPFIARLDSNGAWVYKQPDYELASIVAQGVPDSVFVPPIIGELANINVMDYQFAPLRVSYDTSGGLSVLVKGGFHRGGYIGGGR